MTKVTLLWCSLFVAALSLRALAQDSKYMIEGRQFQDVVMEGTEASNEGQSQLFTVRLEMSKADGRFWGGCTGVVVATDMILTAGHCFPEANMSAVVKFGLGGKAGFSHENKVSAEKIYSNPPIPYHPTLTSKPGGPRIGTPDNGRMAYNVPLAEATKRQMRARTDLVNAARGAQVSNNLTEFALLKISGLPRGYRPIKYYTGPKTFKMPVYAAGYGKNSMIMAKNFTALRWAKQALVGYNKPEGHGNIGFELYSFQGQRLCFDDSGGTNGVYENGEVKLRGSLAVVTSACQGSMWIVDALSIKDRVRVEATRLRRTRMAHD